MAALYDTIGKGYDSTRCADPVIVEQITRLLELRDGRSCLDVACGTGNYTTALAARGGTWSACDISGLMIATARRKSSEIEWQQMDACNLGYNSSCFDGALCTLAIHHFHNMAGVFAELGRVLRISAPFVIFTATPEQMEAYWLCHYFPDMMRKMARSMPALERIRDSLAASGLPVVHTEPFFITGETRDLFIQCGKQRPELYLSPEVRSGISTFHTMASEAELGSGLMRLETDIRTGEINSIMRSFETQLGDYLFIKAVRV